MCFLSFFISQCNFLAWLWFHLLHTLREGGGGIKDVGGQSGGVRGNKAHWGWSHLEDEPSG